MKLTFTKDKYLWIVLVTYLIVVFLAYIPNKAVWWDEAEYLSYARHIVTGKPYSMWDGRAALYPLSLSIPFFFGGSQTALIVFQMTINVVTVTICYLTIKRYFNELIALGTTLTFSLSKLFIFYSFRFLTGVPSLMLLLFALYFFKNKRRLSGLFIGLAIATRFTSLFIIPALIIYQLLNKEKKIKDYYWLIYIILGYSPMLIYDIVQYGNPLHTFLEFVGHNTDAKGAWYFYITKMRGTIGDVSTILLVIGIALLPFYKKINKKYLLFLSYGIIFFLAYSFFGRSKEERYLIPILPVIYLIINQTIYTISKKMSIKKVIYAILVILIISENIALARTIMAKQEYAFFHTKLAGDIIKTLPENEIITTNNGPYTPYYGERDIAPLPHNFSDLCEKMLNDNNKNIVAIDVAQPAPTYFNELINSSFFVLARVISINNYPLEYFFYFNKSEYINHQ